MGSRNLFHRHVQYDHRDILAAKREARRNVPYPTTEVRTQATSLEPEVMMSPVVLKPSSVGVAYGDADSKSINSCEEVVGTDSVLRLESRLMSIRRGTEGETLQAISVVDTRPSTVEVAVQTEYFRYPEQFDYLFGG